MRRILSLLGCFLVLAMATLGPRHIRQWIVWASGDVYVFYTSAGYQTHTLTHPTGVVVCPNSPYQGLFITDSDNNVVRFFDETANTLSVFAGNGTAGYADGTTGQAEFHEPTGIGGMDCGTWIDFQGQSHGWITFNINDSYNYVSRSIEYGYRPFAQPLTFVDSVATFAGNHTQGYVDGPASSAEFSTMAGHHYSAANGSYYIVDTPNHAVRSLAGSTVATFAGNGSPGLVNGYRTSAQFNFPTTATWDSSGNMFVADSGNHAIRKIDTSGNVTTFAGSGNPGFTDGQGTNAQFTNPVSIVFNSADSYFYVTDTGNNSIRRIDSSGNVTTYAGAVQGGLVNGSLLDARFQCPMGLAISNGFMYVADSMNNVIRRIDMTQGTVSTYVS